MGGVSFTVPVSVIIKILPDLKVVLTVPGRLKKYSGISYYGGYVFPVVSFERNEWRALLSLCRNGVGCAYSADRAAEIKILSEEEQSCMAPAGDAGILRNAEGTA